MPRLCCLRAVYGGVDVALHGIVEIGFGHFCISDFAQIHLALAVIVVGSRYEWRGKCSQEQAGEQGVFHVFFRRKVGKGFGICTNLLHETADFRFLPASAPLQSQIFHAFPLDGRPLRYHGAAFLKPEA